MKKYIVLFIAAFLLTLRLLFGLSGTAYAGPPPPTSPCGSYPVIYNSYIYDDQDAYHWFGADGNYTGYPINENQTPPGQPGYGDGPYQNFDVCELPNQEILFWSTAISAWVGASGSYSYGDSPGDEGWSYTCITPGHSLNLVNITTGYEYGYVTFDNDPINNMGERAPTFGGDNFLVKGLCGD